jgi:Response regulator containing a CheY-like receiver domain and an HD-GYP domain
MATPSSKPTETILVVDDEPEVLSMAGDMLRMIGYSVLSAATRSKPSGLPAPEAGHSICS